MSEEEHKSIKRTTKGLRDVLFDEIDALRNGTGDVKRANAVAGIAGTIIKIANAEMAFYRLAKGEGPEDLVERAQLSATPPREKPHGR